MKKASSIPEGGVLPQRGRGGVPQGCSVSVWSMSEAPDAVLTQPRGSGTSVECPVL